jgi:hypothetical protein
MINFKNQHWTIDKWFLKENENINFGYITRLLEKENIPFDIEPVYKECTENIIKCNNSKVTFDFTNEYRFIERNKEGNHEAWIEKKESKEENFVLNGIRLFAQSAQ